LVDFKILLLVGFKLPPFLGFELLFSIGCHFTDNVVHFVLNFTLKQQFV